MVFSIFIALLKVLASMIPVHTKKYGFKKIFLVKAKLPVRLTNKDDNIHKSKALRRWDKRTLTIVEC